MKREFGIGFQRISNELQNTLELVFKRVASSVHQGRQKSYLKGGYKNNYKLLDSFFHGLQNYVFDF